MNEDAFQSVFLSHIATRNPQRVYAPHIQLRYDIGKYSKGRDFTMPDAITDVIEFDEKGDFHLWELKLITSNEVWNGKFFGQMMLYHLLFTTEPWNELAGRFAFAAQNPSFKGEVGKILTHLSGYGSGEIAEESDPNASFKTWNLCICGGSGYELAAGYNPVAWSFWIVAEEYFNETMPEFKIWHFFSTKDGFVLKEMSDLSVDDPSSLHPDSLEAYLALRDSEEE
jgi:hypothetical protein